MRGAITRFAWMAVLAFTFTLPLGAAEEPELIAVLDLRGVKADDAETSALTDRLREELLRTQRFVLVDRSQIDSVLNEQALQQTGCTEQECAVQVGRILGVRKLVVGKVTKLSDTLWLVAALMVDVESARTLRAESVRHQGDFFTLMDSAIVSLATKLAGQAAPAAPQQAAISVPAASRAQRPVRVVPQAGASAVPPADQAPTAAPWQAAISAAASGQIWREPVTGMEFIYMPGGIYEQGCGSWTADCDDDEKPTRRVALSPFWLGRTEVTRGQFAQFVRASTYTTDAETDGGCYVWTGKWEKRAGTGFRDPGFAQDDSHPAACVSWNDARSYAEWLSRKIGQRFRLPTEAEWEYACRAGGKPIKYAWGSGAPDTGGRKAANIADETGRGQFPGLTIWNGYDDGYAYTSPAGSFAPSGLGLYDLTGNVWEWTRDVYSGTAYSGGSASDPDRGDSGAFRVIRGGGWNNARRFVRCSDRGRHDPAFRDGHLGFRLARAN